MASRPTRVQGMLGLGDNLHQRAVVRQLMQRGPVWLETPWPSVYHDLVGPDLHLVRSGTRLRTQAKNAARESGRYSQHRLPGNARGHRIWYTHDQIRATGGFLRAMCHNSGLNPCDFSLPVPPEWRARAARIIDGLPIDKPVMLYRPLVERTEWSGCASRNPDASAYTDMLRHVRSRYSVISVADLVPGVEWAVSPSIGADIEFHAGELDFETLAGLASLVDLVWCSPGFLLVLAQAVRAPMVAVFGGHESARLYDHGYPENCFIEPILPCECFSKSHACDKRVDFPSSTKKLEKFLNEHQA